MEQVDKIKCADDSEQPSVINENQHTMDSTTQHSLCDLVDGTVGASTDSSGANGHTRCAELAQSC